MFAWGNNYHKNYHTPTGQSTLVKSQLSRIAMLPASIHIGWVFRFFCRGSYYILALSEEGRVTQSVMNWSTNVLIFSTGLHDISFTLRQAILMDFIVLSQSSHLLLVPERWKSARLWIKLDTVICVTPGSGFVAWSLFSPANPEVTRNDLKASVYMTCFQQTPSTKQPTKPSTQQQGNSKKQNKIWFNMTRLISYQYWVLRANWVWTELAENAALQVYLYYLTVV